VNRDEQALLLLTNRLLLDWISIAVDKGDITRTFAESLIDFSAAEVVNGAPWTEQETRAYAELFKARLPDIDPK